MCTIFWIAPPQFATELFICATIITLKKDARLVSYT